MKANEMLCPKCKQPMKLIGKVETPPLFVQAWGITEDSAWHRERFACTECMEVVDRLLVSGRIMPVPA